MTERSKRYYRYQKFLNSDKWKEVKAKVLEKYRKMWSGIPDTHFQCFKCRRVFLHKWARYHHISYRRTLFQNGWVRIKNIRIYCNSCHFKRHKEEILKRKEENNNQFYKKDENGKSNHDYYKESLRNIK